MTKNTPSTAIFFANSDLDEQSAKKLVQNGLSGTDYGEFYHEITASEDLTKDNGRYIDVSCGDGSAGFGFRAGQDERVGYAYSNVFNKQSLKETISQSRQVLTGASGTHHMTPSKQSNPPMHPSGNPLAGFDLAQKIQKIDEIEAYTMSLDPNIKNVTVSYASRLKNVHIITADGQSLTEERPITTLSIALQLAGTNNRIETGHAAIGGRVHCKDVFNQAAYQQAAHDALALAKQLLIAKEAPAGVMDIVLNQGWPAVILHEAVGHGLEGDFNRRDISVYSGKLGQQIANPAVTIVDQGDLPGERGSLRFDDEGTPTQENVLVEKGVLKGYMQDRQNAHLMSVQATGNGRRESYEYTPMPRMTNTYFREGEYTQDEMIASIKDGLYIANMSGGQVNITSGQFNMVATLAYRIRNGKLAEPVKGATLIGDGESVIKSINMVGNDLKLEKTAGMCGKNGQSVPVGIGQPSVRVANMTIGGTGKK